MYNMSLIQQLQQVAYQLSQAEARHAQQLNQLAQEESRASVQLQQLINQINQLNNMLATQSTAMGVQNPGISVGAPYVQTNSQFVGPYGSNSTATSGTYGQV